MLRCVVDTKGWIEAATGVDYDGQTAEILRASESPVGDPMIWVRFSDGQEDELFMNEIFLEVYDAC